VFGRLIGEVQEVNTSGEPRFECTTAKCVENSLKTPCFPALPIASLATHSTNRQGGTFRILREHDAKVGALLPKICFCDEATFLLCRKINRQDIRIWGNENPHDLVDHLRPSPKINFFLSSDKVYGHTFLGESRVNGIICCDMLKL
jgi:hypothetical protein